MDVREERQMRVRFLAGSAAHLPPVASYPPHSFEGLFLLLPRDPHPHSFVVGVITAVACWGTIVRDAAAGNGRLL